jgi:hypothetical protein
VLGPKVPPHQTTQYIPQPTKCPQCKKGAKWLRKAGELAVNEWAEIVCRSWSLNTNLRDCETWENLEKDGKMEIVCRSWSLNTNIRDCEAWENLEKYGKNNNFGL